MLSLSTPAIARKSDSNVEKEVKETNAESNIHESAREKEWLRDPFS